MTPPVSTSGSTVGGARTLEGSTRLRWLMVATAVAVGVTLGLVVPSMFIGIEPPTSAPTKARAIGAQTSQTTLDENIGTLTTAHSDASAPSNRLQPFYVDYQPGSVNTLLQFHLAETVKEVERYTATGPYHARRALSVLGRLEGYTATASPRDALMWPAVSPAHYIRWAGGNGEGGPFSFASCPALLERDRHEFASLLQTATHPHGDPLPKYDGFGFTTLFYEFPTYNLPWYYHAPMPVCGRFLLRLMEARQFSNRGASTNTVTSPSTRHGNTSLGSLRSMGIAAVGAMPRLFGYGKKGEMDRRVLPRAGDLRSYIADPVVVQRNVHRVVSHLPAATSSSNPKLAWLPTVEVEANSVSSAIHIENCGAMGGPRYFGPAAPDGSDDDVLIMARLAGPHRIVGATVVPEKGSDAASSSMQYRVRFVAPDFIPPSPSVGVSHVDANEYVLEIRYVHVNGTDGDWRNPYPLGTIGIRANNFGKKGFKYNLQCDMQRHIYGSPLVVRVVPPTETLSTASVALHPQCTSADHVDGRWVEYAMPPSGGGVDTQHYIGNPTWLADAAGLNGKFLWRPDACRYSFWNPPQGPTVACVRRQDEGGQEYRSGALLLVGDSVTREYAKSCMQFDLGKAKLVCVFNNIALEGQHYSPSYASAVIENILDAIVREKAAVFATNLGIHHMIGPCHTYQWREFVQLFAAAFQRRLQQRTFSVMLPASTDSNNVTAAVRAASVPHHSQGVPFTVEQLIWIGSPAIHYARRGMGFQRGVEWDEIAWEALRPIGFRRVNALPPTQSRQEGTWDGLHYAAERGKVQTPWRNKQAPVRSWNGGVSSMLFTMFLNLVCFGA